MTTDLSFNCDFGINLSFWSMSSPCASLVRTFTGRGFHRAIRYGVHPLLSCSKLLYFTTMKSWTAPLKARSDGMVERMNKICYRKSFRKKIFISFQDIKSAPEIFAISYFKLKPTEQLQQPEHAHAGLWTAKFTIDCIVLRLFNTIKVIKYPPRSGLNRFYPDFRRYYIKLSPSSFSFTRKPPKW